MRSRWIVPALAIAAGFGGLAGFAVAQSGDGRETLPQSASDLYDRCIANDGSKTECACTAGFYGGRLKPDEFRMVSVLSGHLGPDGELTDPAAALQDMRTEAQVIGMGDARFQEVMERFSTMDRDGAYGDQVCVGLRDR